MAGYDSHGRRCAGIYGGALSARVHEGDIAAVAVRALLEDGHHGRTYALTGPEALTRKEAVRTIAAAIGKDIPFVELSEEEARQQWRDQGYDEESVEFFVQMAKNTPEAGYTVLPTILQVLGRPARTSPSGRRSISRSFCRTEEACKMNFAIEAHNCAIVPDA
ncbi:hypothetical protein HMSSN036_55610 [Paenibacillus macerans]|nr:hypothetical protein HMSSN036_55610 [Paenibacillus macerans]